MCTLCSLQANGRVIELDHSDGKLKIHYSDRLVSLLREVRQLSALGFAIPAKIQHTANTAQKFYRQAIILKQVSTVFLCLIPLLALALMVSSFLTLIFFKLLFRVRIQASLLNNLTISRFRSLTFTILLISR